VRIAASDLLSKSVDTREKTAAGKGLFQTAFALSLFVELALEI
jgi:hypothetical protein